MESLESIESMELADPREIEREAGNLRKITSLCEFIRLSFEDEGSGIVRS